MILMARKLENIANTTWNTWLTTEDGQKFVAAVKMKRRLSGDVPDVNRLAKFELQRNEMLQGVKEIRTVAEEEIAAVEEEINMRREKMKSDIAEHRKHFKPVCDYIPISNLKLNEKCWEYYAELNKGKSGIRRKPEGGVCDVF